MYFLKNQLTTGMCKLEDRFGGNQIEDIAAPSLQSRRKPKEYSMFWGTTVTLRLPIGWYQCICGTNVNTLN